MLGFLAAGCGSSSSTSSPPPAETTQPAAQTIPVPTLTATATRQVEDGPLRYRARLVAGTHTPTVDTPWHYAVHVTDLKGKPLASSVHVQVLAGGKIVDTIGWHGFTGTWEETIKWPADSKGSPLVFQAEVFGPGGSKSLNYPIEVQ